MAIAIPEKIGTPGFFVVANPRRYGKSFLLQALAYQRAGNTRKGILFTDFETVKDVQSAGKLMHDTISKCVCNPPFFDYRGEY